MNTTIKNYLGIAGIIGLLLAAFAFWSFSATYARAVRPNGFPTFTVSGEGRVVTVPDIAHFTFSVVTEGGTNLGVLQKENTEKMNKAIAAIKAAGVVAKDIKTESYSITPRYQTYSCNQRPIYYGSGAGSVVPVEPCPPSSIVGYTIAQTVSVKIRDFAKVGDIVKIATESGANTVSGISFTIDDPAAVENEARADAIKKAREKAELIARAGGFRIGRLISINEGGYYPYDRGVVALSAEKGGAPAPVPAPTIEPGSQEVRVNVSVTYEMK